MIFIPAFAIPGSKSEEAFLLVVRGKVSLFTSPAIMAETANKLREKFDLSDDQILLVLKQISKTAGVIKPKEKIAVLKDDPITEFSNVLSPPEPISSSPEINTF